MINEHRRKFIQTGAALTVLSQFPLLATAASEEFNSGLPKNQGALKAKIVSSGDSLLRIGLGTYQTFDVGTDLKKREELSKVLKIFIQAGGEMLDSSPMYGSSEEVIGDLTSTLDLNSRLFLATKVWTTGKAEGVKQMLDSMAKLRRNKLELMQIHNLVDWKTHLNTLNIWKTEKKIKYVGITHYTASAFPEMETILKTNQIDFIQIPISMTETESEKRLVPLAKDKGVTIIANQPFAQGRLFQMTKGKTLPKWSSEFGIQSWAQYFLKFILAHPDIHFVIPGTGTVAHLEDNIQASFGKLPAFSFRKKMLDELYAL